MLIAQFGAMIEIEMHITHTDMFDEIAIFHNPIVPK